MLAAMALGAERSAVGSRFAASVESSGHENFKKKITESHEGETVLTLKKLTPVRLIKNDFYKQVEQAEARARKEELKIFWAGPEQKREMVEGKPGRRRT